MMTPPLARWPTASSLAFTATAALLTYYAFPAEVFFSVLGFSLLVQFAAYAASRM
jgi:hypothetical protein